MSHKYPLNLFPAKISDNKISTLTGEKFLRAGSQMVLKLLWKKWDDEFLPTNIFNRDFFNFLSDNHHAIPSFYKAILKNRDPFFLKSTRLEIQDSFNRLLDTLSQTPPISNAHKLKVELAIYNMLSMYVMFSPTPHETLTIPHFSDNKWQGIEFNIEPIELTPTQGWWINFFSDQDRLFSYGFRAKNNKKVASILTHCGTGWTTSQGSLIQVIADLWPNKTPGEIFFKWQGGKAINDFLESNEQKVIINGHSLGGSLSYLTAMAHPLKVEKAICLSPPGMAYDYDKNHPLFGNWSSTPQKNKPQVIIQKQTYDPVSKCGIFKNDFKLAKIHIKKEPKTSSIALRFLTSHARNFSACNDSEITISKMEDENKSIFRAANNYYLYNKARPLLFYGLLMPYFFIIKPLKESLEKNAFVIFLTLLLCLTAIIFPSLTALFFLEPTITTLIGASYIISFSTNILLDIVYDLLFNNFLNFKSYIKYFQNKTALYAFAIFLFDTINIVSFGILKFLISVIHKIFHEIPYFFYKQQTLTAEIHTKIYNDKTNDLNNHPSPQLSDKLQVLSIIILFYFIVFPIKVIFYDLPSLIGSFFSYNKSPSYESSRTPNNTNLEPLNNNSSSILVEKQIKPEDLTIPFTTTGCNFFQDNKDKTNKSALNTHSVTSNTLS